MSDVPTAPSTPYGRLRKAQDKYLQLLAQSDTAGSGSPILIASESVDASRSYGVTTVGALCDYLGHPLRPRSSLYQVIVTNAEASHKDFWIDIEWYAPRGLTLVQQLRRVRSDNVDRVLQVLGDRQPSHIALSCASGPVNDRQHKHKYSWHAILKFDDGGPTYAASEMKNAVLESCARDSDLAVYTRSQCLRLVGCTKASDPYRRELAIIGADTGAAVLHTPNRVLQHLVRTVARPATHGGSGAVHRASAPAPPWVQYLLQLPGESPWCDIRQHQRAGAQHWKGERFYIVPLRSAAGMVCPIAGRKHRRYVAPRVPARALARAC